MKFKEWLSQEDWLDNPVLEGMLALHRRFGLAVAGGRCSY